jgi:hypothetical protein
MTPETLKGLIEWAKWSYELVGPELADLKSKQPKGVRDVILERVIAQTAARSRAAAPAISIDSEGSWRVAGLDMVFLTRADAEVAVDVIAAVRETEESEGRSSQ